MKMQMTTDKVTMVDIADPRPWTKTCERNRDFASMSATYNIPNGNPFFFQIEDFWRRQQNPGCPLNAAPEEMARAPSSPKKYLSCLKRDQTNCLVNVAVHLTAYCSCLKLSG
jgi:hypothetical protein